MKSHSEDSEVNDNNNDRKKEEKRLINIFISIISNYIDEHIYPYLLKCIQSAAGLEAFKPAACGHYIMSKIPTLL